MAYGSILSCRAGWLLVTVFLAGAVVVLWVGPRKGGPTPPTLRLDDWDIPRLVAHLRDKGVEVRAVSTDAGGVVHGTAFLTTTGKGWDDFIRLPNDERRAGEWRGTVFCGRGMPEGFCSDITCQWGDGSLVVGPFLFYGDPELLGRFRAALTPHEP